MINIASYTFRESEFLSKAVMVSIVPITLLALLSPLFGSKAVIVQQIVGIFIVLSGWLCAGIAWFCYHELWRKFKAARRSEKVLREKNLQLSSSIQKQSAELHQSHINELEQLYRLAELGQSGVALLHDLANHLSVLTLEVEGMQSRQKSEEYDRIKKVINYLEATVDNTRKRLHGDLQNQSFDVVSKVNDVIDLLRHKAAKVQVEVEWQPTLRSLHYVGDATRFCQVMTYIVNNAIEAYATTNAVKPKVAVAMELTDSCLLLKIRDWGKGINYTARQNLFKPFCSTKKTGLGLGLFISRRIIETNFSGSLSLNPSSDYTEFIVSLPLELEHEKQ